MSRFQLPTDKINAQANSRFNKFTPVYRSDDDSDDEGDRGMYRQRDDREAVGTYRSSQGFGFSQAMPLNYDSVNGINHRHAHGSLSVNSQAGLRASRGPALYNMHTLHEKANTDSGPGATSHSSHTANAPGDRSEAVTQLSGLKALSPSASRSALNPAVSPNAISSTAHLSLQEQERGQGEAGTEGRQLVAHPARRARTLGAGEATVGDGRSAENGSNDTHDGPDTGDDSAGDGDGVAEGRLEHLLSQHHRASIIDSVRPHPDTVAAASNDAPHVHAEHSGKRAKDMRLARKRAEADADLPVVYMDCYALANGKSIPVAEFRHQQQLAEEDKRMRERERLLLERQRHITPSTRAQEQAQTHSEDRARTHAHSGRSSRSIGRASSRSQSRPGSSQSGRSVGGPQVGKRMKSALSATHSTIDASSRGDISHTRNSSSSGAHEFASSSNLTARPASSHSLHRPANGGEHAFNAHTRAHASLLAQRPSTADNIGALRTDLMRARKHNSMNPITNPALLKLNMGQLRQHQLQSLYSRPGTSYSTGSVGSVGSGEVLTGGGSTPMTGEFLSHRAFLSGRGSNAHAYAHGEGNPLQSPMGTNAHPSHHARSTMPQHPLGRMMSEGMDSADRTHLLSLERDGQLLVNKGGYVYQYEYADREDNMKSGAGLKARVAEQLLQARDTMTLSEKILFSQHNLKGARRASKRGGVAIMSKKTSFSSTLMNQKRRAQQGTSMLLCTCVSVYGYI